MAKYELRLKARELRSSGESIKKIANILGVARSSVSVWTQDILLTEEQLQVLNASMLSGAQLGRLRSAQLRKEIRLKRIQEAKKEGIELLTHIEARELLIAGLALYWGEGSKKKIEVSFCNSDPEMIKFWIRWLEICFSVSSKDLRFCIGINEIHRDREAVVKDYWINTLNISGNQFEKTSFKKVKNKKIYLNHNAHYGTLRVRVLKSVALHYKIIGLIEGLKANLAG